MEFTFNSYQNLVCEIKQAGYVISSYHNWHKYERCAILRHDVDYDINKAVDFASMENKVGIHSTYFVLLTSDFYNVFSKKTSDSIKKILSYGHEIGLHFDETCYPEAAGKPEEICSKIIEESRILELVIQEPVKVVSMHRPSKEVIRANLQIPDMVNSYSKQYFEGFKYLSDSRRNWREPVDEIIKSREFDKLHILTHPFWYNEEEKSANNTISSFVNRAGMERYYILDDNITNLRSIMSEQEIVR